MASTSVAICDESPLLQSIGPTVIKKKTRPDLNVAPLNGRNLILMKKKKSPYRQYWPTKFIIYR
jgi:hypothetical protein